MKSIRISFLESRNVHGHPLIESAGGTDAPLLHPVEVAARRIGIGRTKMYGLISDGSILTVQIGSRRLVAEADLQDFVNRLRSGGHDV